MGFLKNVFLGFFSFLNKILPKKNTVLILGTPNAESSAVEVANYLALHYDIPSYFVISNDHCDNPEPLLHTKCKIINKKSRYGYTVFYIVKFITSKYIFSTHGHMFKSFPKNQIVINIWHGVLYKNINKLEGKDGVFANITVATSELTQNIFAKAFDVPVNGVIITGYPRNDALLRAQENKSLIKQKIQDLSQYDKIIVWLPTYREKQIGSHRLEGREVGNPFYIQDFDIRHFDAILQKHNALCIVKPHPVAVKHNNDYPVKNILFIDDKWVTDHSISLYQLLGCCDILVSDVSSVIVDFLLLDLPILCIAEDFDDYKKERGFYFKDIEEKIPTKVLKNQEQFFESLSNLLITNSDPYQTKRENLKQLFFTHTDTNSTKRLVDYVMQY